MDEDDYNKKLQLGKEKFAAFRKKKSKKKRKRAGGEDGGLTSDTSASDMSSMGEESDLEGTDSDTDKGGVSLMAHHQAQNRLLQQKERITELEETLYGKQAALDSLLDENEELRASLQHKEQGQVNGNSLSIKDLEVSSSDDQEANTLEELKSKLSELLSVVSERDQVIEQLSGRLATSDESRDQLQTEYTSQAEQMAQQVLLLQEQLKQANVSLHAPVGSGERSFPVQALLEAKNELLAVQQVSHQKDSQLLALQNALKQRDATLQHLTGKFNESTRDYAGAHEELRTIKDKLERSTERCLRLERETDKLRVNYTEQAKQLAELRKTHSDGSSLAESSKLFQELQAENRELRRKDMESGSVITQLMSSVESFKSTRKSPSPDSSFTEDEMVAQEEHLKQMQSLRSELDEVYGEQISQIKDTIKEQYESRLHKLSQEVDSLSAENSHLSSQVTRWQQQYVSLGEQNVSSTDLISQISQLTSENAEYRQQVEELREKAKESGRQETQKVEMFSTSEKTKLVNEMEDAKTKLVELAELCEQGQVFREKAEELSQQVKQMQSEQDVYLNKIDAQKKHIEQLNSVLTETSSQRDSYKVQLDASEKALLEAKTSHGEELGLIRSQFEQKAQLDLAELQGELAAARAEIEIAHEHKRHSSSDIPHKDLELLMGLHKEQLETLKSEYESKLKAASAEQAATHSTGSGDQVEPAQEHLVIQQQYENTVSELVSRLHQVEAQNAALLAQQDTTGVGEGAVDILDLTAKLSQTAMERDSALKSVQDLYSDRVEQKQELDQLKRDKEGLERRLLLVMKEYDQVVNDKAKINEELSLSVSRSQEIQDQLNESSFEMELLNTQLQDLSSQKTTVQSELSDLKQEKEAIEGQLGALLTERETLQTQMVQYQLAKEEDTQSDLADQLKAQFNQVKLQYSMELEKARTQHLTTLTKLEEVMKERQVLQARHAQELSDMRLAYDSLRAQYAAQEKTEQATVSSTDTSAVQDDQEVVSKVELQQLKMGYSVVYAEMTRLREALVQLQDVNTERENVKAQFETQVAELKQELEERERIVSGVQETHTVVSTAPTVVDGPQLDLESVETQTDVFQSSSISTETEACVLSSQSAASQTVSQDDLGVPPGDLLDSGSSLALPHQTHGENNMEGLVEENSELQEQVRSLQEEIQLVNDYDRSSTPVRDPSIGAGVGDEVSHLQRHLTEARSTIDQLLAQQQCSREDHEQELTQLVKKLDAYVEDNQAVQAEFDKDRARFQQEMQLMSQRLEQAISEKHSLSEVHHKHMEQLQHDKQASEEDMAHQLEQVDAEHGIEVATYKKQIADLKSDVESLRAEKSQLEAEFESEMHDMSEEQSTRVRSIRESYEQEIDSLRTALNEINTTISDQQEELISRYENEIESLKFECGDVDLRLRQVMDEKDTLQDQQEEILKSFSEEQAEGLHGLLKQIEDLTAGKRASAERVLALNAQLEFVQMTVDQLEEDNKRLRDNINELNMQKTEVIGNLQVEMDQHQQALLQLEADNQRLQDQLSAEGQSAGSLDAVDSNVAVPLVESPVIALKTSAAATEGGSETVGSESETVGHVCETVEGQSEPVGDQIEPFGDATVPSEGVNELVCGDSESTGGETTALEASVMEEHSAEAGEQTLCVEDFRQQILQLETELQSLHDEKAKVEHVYQEEISRQREEDDQLLSIQAENEQLHKSCSEQSAALNNLALELDLYKSKIADSDHAVKSIEIEKDESIANLESSLIDLRGENSRLLKERDDANEEVSALIAGFRSLQPEGQELDSCHDVLVSNVQDKLTVVQSMLDEAEAKVKMMEQEKEAASVESSKVMEVMQDVHDKEVESLKSQITLLQQGDAQSHGLQSQLSSLQEERDSLQSQLSSLQEERNSLQSQLDSSQEERDSLQSQLSLLQNKCDNLQSQTSSSQQEHDSIQSQLASSQAESDSLHSQLASSQEESHRLHSQLASSQEESDSLQSQLSLLKKDCESLQSQLASSQEERDSLQSQLASSQEDLDSLRSQLSSSQEDCDTTLSQLASSQEYCDSLQSKLTVSQQDHDDLEKEMTHKVQVLENEKTSMSVHLKQALEDMEVKVKEELSALHERLRDLEEEKKLTINDLQVQLQAKKDQVSHLMEEQAFTVIQSQSLEAEIASLLPLSDELREKEELLLEANSEIEALQHKFTQLGDDLKSSLAENIDRTSMLELSRAETGTLQQDIENLQADVESLESEKRTLLEGESALKDELAKKTRQVEEMVIVIENMESGLTNLQSSSSHAETTAYGLHEAVESLEREVGKFQMNCDQLEMENEELQSKVVELKRQIEEGHSAGEAQRARYEELEEEKLSMVKRFEELKQRVDQEELLLGDARSKCQELDPSGLSVDPGDDGNKQDQETVQLHHQIKALQDQITSLSAENEWMKTDKQQLEEALSGFIENNEIQTATVDSGVAMDKMPVEEELVELTSQPQVHSSVNQGWEDAVFEDEVAEADSREVENLRSQLLMSSEENDALRSKFEAETSRLRSQLNDSSEEGLSAEERWNKSDDTALKQVLLEQEEVIKRLKDQVQLLTNQLTATSTHDVSHSEGTQEVSLRDIYVSSIKQLNQDLMETRSHNSQLEEELLKLQSQMDEPEGHKAPLSGDAMPSNDKVIEEIQQQHGVEIKVLEYNLTERHNQEVRGLKAGLMDELEREYKQKEEELKLACEQQVKSHQAESERQFVEELRKVRQELDRKHTDSLERLRVKYETDLLHQEYDGDTETKHQDMILKLHTDKAELCEARDHLLQQLDASHRREEELQEQMLAMTSNASLTSPANDASLEFDGEEWRVRYDQLMGVKKALEEQLEAQQRSDEGLQLPSNHEELQVRLEELQTENENLKTRLQDHSLGIQEHLQEELMDMYAKYRNIVQENEVLTNRLKDSGLHTDSAKSDPVSRESSRDGFLDPRLQVQASLQGNLDRATPSSNQGADNVVSAESASKEYSVAAADSDSGSSVVPAEKYQALSAEHQCLQDEFNKYRDKARKEHTKMKAKAVAASREVEKLKGQLAALSKPDTANENLMLELIDLQSQNAVLISENTVYSESCKQAEELEIRCDELERANKDLIVENARSVESQTLLGELQSRCENLNQRNEELESENRLFKESHKLLTELESQCDELSKKNAELTAVSDNARAELSDCQKAGEDLSKLQSTYQELLADHRQSLQGLEEVQSNYEAESASNVQLTHEVEKLKESLNQQRKSNKASLHQLGEENKQLKNAKADRNFRVRELEGEKEEMAKKNEALITASQAVVTELEARVSSLEREKSDLHVQFDSQTLENLRTEYEEQVSSLRAELGEALHSPTKVPQNTPDTDLTQQEGATPEGQEGLSHEDVVREGSSWLNEEENGVDKKSEAGASFTSMTSSVFQQELAALRRTANDFSGLERLEQAYGEEMKQLQQSHQTDLHLQLEALKLTMQQVHKSQLRLVQEELEGQSSRSLELQKQKLADHYHESIAQLKRELSEQESSAGLAELTLHQSHEQELSKERQLYEQKLTETEEQYEETVAGLQTENAQLREAAKFREVDEDLPQNLISKDVQRLRESSGVVCSSPTDEVHSLSSMGDFSQAEYSSSLIAELQGEIESYRIQIESYKQEAEERRTYELDTLREKFEQEYEWKLDDLKNQHRQQMESMERELKEEFSGGQLVRSQQEDVVRLTRQLAASQEQVDMLKAKHKEQMDRIRSPSPRLEQEVPLNKLRQEQEGALDKLRQDLEAEHSLQIKSLEAQHEEAMKKEQERHATGDQLLDLNERIGQEVTRVRNEQEALMEQELEAMRDKVKNDLQKVYNEDLELEKRQWKLIQEAETAKLVELHQLAIKELSLEMVSVQDSKPETSNRMSARIKELESAKHCVEQNKAAIENELRQCKQRIDKLEKQNKKLSSKPPWSKSGASSVKIEEGRMQELENKVDEREVQIEELTLRLDEAENALRERETLIKDYENRMEEYDDRLEMFKSQLALFENTISDNEGQIDDLTIEAEDYKTQLEEVNMNFKAQLNQYESEIRELKSQHGEQTNTSNGPTECDLDPKLQENSTKAPSSSTPEESQSLIDSYKKEISDLNELFASKEKDFNDLRAKHKKAVTNLSMQLAKSDEKYEPLLVKRDREIEQLTSDINCIKQQHQQEVDDLKKQLRSSSDLDLEDDVNTDIENGDLRSSQTSEVGVDPAAEGTAPASILNQLEAMKKAHQEEKEQLEAQHRNVVDDLTKQHSELVAEMQSDHEEDLHALRLRLQPSTDSHNDDVAGERIPSPRSHASSDDDSDMLAQRLSPTESADKVPRLALPSSCDEESDDEDVGNEADSDRDLSDSQGSERLLAYSRVLEEPPGSPLGSPHSSPAGSPIGSPRDGREDHVMGESQELELACESASQNLQNELSRFEADHTGELDDIRSVIQEQILSENMEKIHGMTSQLESEHQGELDHLRAGYQKMIAALKEQLAAADSGGRHSRMRIASETELENGEDELCHHDDEQQQQVLQVEARLEELAASKMAEFTQHMEEIERLKSVFAEETDTLRSELSAERDAVVESMKAEKDELTRRLQDYESREEGNLGELEKYKSEITSLRSQLDAYGDATEVEQLKQTIMDRVTEIEDLQANKKRVLLEKDAQISQLLADVDCKTSELQRLKGEDSGDGPPSGGVASPRGDVSSLLQELKEELDKRDDQMKALQREADENLASELKALREKLEEERETEVEEVRQRLQLEISALRQSLEAVDAEKETEMQREYGESLERLREQHFTEIAVKNEQLDKLSIELVQKGEALQQFSRQVDEYEDQLEAQSEQLERLLQQASQQKTSTPDEGDNLLTLLQADLQRVTAERDATQQTNEQIMRLLSESVRTAVTSTENIHQRLDSVAAVPSHSPPLLDLDADVLSPRASGMSRSPPGEDPDSAVHNTSILSTYTDEGLDISQHFAESMFLGPQHDADTDEVVTEANPSDTYSKILLVTDANSRLHAAVERLLDMIAETNKQLNEAQSKQTQLVAELQLRGQEVTDLTQKCADLEQRVIEETESREFLALELSKTEGLLHGYEDEKNDMDLSLRSLEDKKEVLAEELEHAQLQLAQFTQGQRELVAREDDIRRQRETLEKSIGCEEQVVPADACSQTDVVAAVDPQPEEGDATLGLLQENTKLNEEKRELQRQHTQQQEEQHLRITALQATIEELHSDNEAILEERKIIVDDQQKQIEALEKQLRITKQFLEDQTAEREQEREEFIQEMQSLRDDMQQRNRQDSAQQRLTREVMELEDHLREKADASHELALKKEQVERDLIVAQTQVDELQDMLKLNEAEWEGKERTLSLLNKKLESAESELTKQHGDTVLNRPADPELTGAEGLQRIIQDLEAQVDTLRESERRSLDRIKCLEEELKNLHTLEDELTSDKKSLQKQVNEQLMVISALRVQVEGIKFASIEQTGAGEQRREIQELRFQLEDEQTATRGKEKQINELSEQLDQFREQLLDQGEEASQLSVQLQVSETEHKHAKQQLQTTIDKLQETNVTLKCQVDTLRDGTQTSLTTLTQTLLDEKNEEIDQLNAQVERLSTQLTPAADRGQQQQLTLQIQALKEQLDLQSVELEAKNALLEEQASNLDLKNSSQEPQQLTLTPVPGDILNELEKRNDELNQQKEVSDKYNSQVQQLREELDELNKLSQEQVQEISEKNQHLEEQSSEIEANHQIIEKLHSKVEVLTQQKQDLLARNKEIEECIPKLEAKVIEIQDQGQELAQKSQRVQELEASARRVHQLTVDVEAKNMEIAELERVIASLKHTAAPAGEGTEEAGDLSTATNNELPAPSHQHLTTLITAKELQIEDLRDRLQQRDFDFLQSQEQQESHHQEALVALQDQVDEKEGLVTQLQAQVEHLQGEVTSLQTYQARLHDDFDEVQAMNEVKQKEIETLTHDMEELRPLAEGMTSDLQIQFETEIRTLTRDVQEKQNIIDEKEEEMYILNERLEKQHGMKQELLQLTSLYEKQTEELDARDQQLADLLQQLEQRDADSASTQQTPPTDPRPSELTQSHKESVADLRAKLELAEREMSLQMSALSKAQHEKSVLEKLLKDQAASHEVKVAVMEENGQQLQHTLSTQSRLSQNTNLLELETKHQADLTKLKAIHESHNNHIQELQEKYKRELLNKHNLELQDQEEKHSQLRDEVRAKYKAQINDLHQNHNVQLTEVTERLQAECSLNKDRYESEMQRLSEEHEMLLSKMRRTHEEDMEAQREELVKGQKLAVEEVRRSLHRYHTEEIDRLVLEHQREVEDTRLQAETGGVGDESLCDGPSGQLEGQLKRFMQELTTNDDLTYLDDSHTSTLQSILDRVKGGGKSVLTLSDIKFLQDLAANQSYASIHGAPDQSESSYNLEGESNHTACEEEKKALLTAVSSLKTLLVETQKSRDSSKGAEEDWRADLLKAVHEVFASEQETVLARLHSHEVTHGPQPNTQQLQQQVHDMGVQQKGAMQQLLTSDRQSLLGEVNELRSQVHDLRDQRNRATTEKSSLEEEGMSKERHLNRQMELLQYKLQQERVLGEDLQHSLDTERQRAQDLFKQLAQQQTCNSGLQDEISRTRTQLDKLTQALQHEQDRLMAASDALEVERRRSSQLDTEMTVDRERFVDCVDSEKQRSLQFKERSDRSEAALGKLLKELEAEKEQHLVTTGALEQEKCESERLWRELNQERERLRNTEDKLRSSVDFERSHIADLQALLGVSADVRATLGADSDSTDVSRLERAATRGDVQAAHDLLRLTLRHSQKACDKQRSKNKREVDTALQTCRDLNNTIEALEIEKREMASELEFAGDKVRVLTVDRERLQASLSSSTVRVVELEARLKEAGSNSVSPEASVGFKRQLESVRQRQQLLAIRHQEELARCSSIRELAHNSEVTSIQEALSDLLTDLHQLHGNPDVPSTASSPSLNEKTLRHNRELTSYVSTMSANLQSLRNELSTVEEELAHLRLKEDVYQQAQHAEDDLSSQRARWSEERAAMSLQLHEAHSELGRLRDDLRRSEIQLEREREKYLPTTSSGELHAPLDRDKMQRLYGKYLRAESFRKALIYQKKYLLTLIGGFEDGEEQTLALLSRMGAHPSHPISSDNIRSKPLFRFRSAVTVVIATARLRYLMKKWKRATRVGVPVISGSAHNQHGSTYIPQQNGFTPPRRAQSSSTLPHAPSTLPLTRTHSHTQHGAPLNTPHTAKRTMPHSKDAGPSSLLYNGHHHSSSISSKPTRRPLHGALGPMPDPTPTPPPSLSSRGGSPRPAGTPTHDLTSGDSEKAEQSINDYIQRLENLQQRLGNVTKSTRSQKYVRR